MAVNWRELFPTKLTFAIFILYMSLFIGQGKLSVYLHIIYKLIYIYVSLKSRNLIILFIISIPGIFVTASQESNNSYSYNTVTVVLLTEVLKLIVSGALYLRELVLVSIITQRLKLSNRFKGRHTFYLCVTFSGVI